MGYGATASRQREGKVGLGGLLRLGGTAATALRFASLCTYLLGCLYWRKPIFEPAWCEHVTGSLSPTL